jgi:xylulokinase
MAELLLGLDIGTTHVKAVLATPEGQVLARAATGYPTSHPRPGWAEQAPSDWWDGVARVTRAVTRDAPGRVAGIGVSGQGCAVTLIGPGGEVLRPAIIWMDSRSEEQSQRLRDCCLAEILARNGKHPAPYNADPVLMWLHEHEPASIAGARVSLTTTAYVNFRLTGEAVANLSDASILFAFDLANRSWSGQFIEDLGLPARLYPALAECDRVIGALTPEAAADLGLYAGIPVVAGGEDTSAAGLAFGAARPGLAYLSLGTAGTEYVPVSTLAVQPQLLTFLHVLPGQYLLGGSMVAIGAALAWCRQLLGLQVDFPELISLAEGAEPGAGNLLYLPYMSGELQPINDGNARGVLFGLTLSTDRSQLLRAILEGTAFAIAHNLSIVESTGIAVDEIRASGGPTRSAAWCQIIADVTGRHVSVVHEESGAPLGSALLAGKGAGLIDDIAAVALGAARVECAFEPDRQRHDRYRSLLSIYRQLYPQVREQFAQLARLP